MSETARWFPFPTHWPSCLCSWNGKVTHTGAELSSIRLETWKWMSKPRNSGHWFMVCGPGWNGYAESAWINRTLLHLHYKGWVWFLYDPTPDEQCHWGSAEHVTIFPKLCYFSPMSTTYSNYTTPGQLIPPQWNSRVQYFPSPLRWAAVLYPQCDLLHWWRRRERLLWLSEWEGWNTGDISILPNN